MLHALVYMSSATEPFDDGRLEDVLEYSRRRNTDEGLTGMLVHRNGRFMQLLEGPYDAVIAAYARIVGDPRHGDVQLMVEESIHTRRFPEWTMAFDRGAEDEVPDGFSEFLADGDRSADLSRSRELLRWFRRHPLADPAAAGAKHRLEVA